MKKTIIIIIIAILLNAFAIYEVVSVSNFNATLQSNVMSLPKKYEENKSNISVLTEDVKIIGQLWEDNENKLFLIFSHKDLSATSDSINRLLSYTENNDYINAYVEVKLLVSYVDKNTSIMGFNVQNVL